MYNEEDMLGYVKSVVRKAANGTYSTEETIVGKWINGEPIYRKVIELTDPSVFQKGVAFKVCDIPEGFTMLINGSAIIRTYEGSYSNSDILVYSNTNGIMAKQNFTGYPQTMFVIVEYIREES